VRYYDLEDKKIHESFLKFVPVTDLSGRSLAQTIIDELTKLKLDLNYLRGQGYDGAAAMSGKFNGVQACIRETYKSALYVHCSAHNLNLSVSYACNIASIRNAMSTIENIYVFLNTPKRKFEFSNHLNKFKEDNSCMSQKEKLKRLCPTRWSERYDSIDVFYDFQPVIISCFEEMMSSPNTETSSRSAQLLAAIQTSEFNVSLIVIHKIFQYTKTLCSYLQKTNLDLFQALYHIDLIISELQKIRENCDDEFHKYFEELTERSNKMDFEITIPRKVKRQKHRSNYSTDDPEHFFKISIFLPFVDSLVQQLKDRFLNHKNIIAGFCFLISNENYDNQGIKDLSEFYSNDIDQEVFEVEVKLWRTHLQKLSVHGLLDALDKCNKDLFPNVFKLLQIFATLPVTSCEPERSFSTLKRIKTYLRNSVGQLRLNGLAALNIHREVDVEVEEVIKVLAKQNRRTDFIL